jgi:hypothetical protein
MGEREGVCRIVCDGNFVAKRVAIVFLLISGD